MSQKDSELFDLCERSDLFDHFNLPSAVCVEYDSKGVFFLLVRRGDAMEIHVGAKGRESKRWLREASREITERIPDWFPWCEMLIAPVNIKSVYNLCKKIGFIDTGKAEFEHGSASVMVIDYERGVRL